MELFLVFVYSLSSFMDSCEIGVNSWHSLRSQEDEPYWIICCFSQEYWIQCARLKKKWKKLTSSAHLPLKNYLRTEVTIGKKHEASVKNQWWCIWACCCRKMRIQQAVTNSFFQNGVCTQSAMLSTARVLKGDPMFNAKQQQTQLRSNHLSKPGLW